MTDDRALLEAHRMLERAADALERSYDATEWPADGTSTQEQAAKAIRDFLAAASLSRGEG